MAAQVKFYAQPVGRPALQALYGAATATGRQAWFFATKGYTEHARGWGTAAGMALFELSPNDSAIVGCTPMAEKLLQTLLHSVTPDHLSRAELVEHLGRREAELSRLHSRVNDTVRRCRGLLNVQEPTLDPALNEVLVALAADEDATARPAVEHPNEVPASDLRECRSFRRRLGKLIHPDLPSSVDERLRSELMALVNASAEQGDLSNLTHILRDIEDDPSCERAMTQVLIRKIDSVEAQIAAIQSSIIGRLVSTLERSDTGHGDLLDQEIARRKAPISGAQEGASSVAAMQ